jgi:hypothetical protein
MSISEQIFQLLLLFKVQFNLQETTHLRYNLLKHPNNIHKFNLYLTENTMPLHYKNKFVNGV